MGWRWSSVIECLPGTHKALVLFPVPAITSNNNNKPNTQESAHVPR